jgi:2-oxoisovalerate dehydrogenase E1 component
MASVSLRHSEREHADRLPATGDVRQQMVESMARIRAFELELLNLFSKGKLSGTTHTCVGQEACAAALYAHIDSQRDAAFSNHRCHGHFLAYGGPMRDLLAEILGKVGGTCGSRGGSQHLCYRQFFSQGIQGGSMPIAVGYAHRLKQQGTGGIVVAHIGDGTLGEGLVYESLNFASLLSVPLLIVLEHNGLAQSTETARTTAGDVEARFRAFGIQTDRRRADDPVGLAGHFANVVESVRQGRPFVQVLDTFRLMPHSKGDDSRPADVLQAAWNADYLQRLLDEGDAVAHRAWDLARAEVSEVVAELESQPVEELGTPSAYAPPRRELFQSSSDLVLEEDASELQSRINELLGAGLQECLTDAPETMIVGEDIQDPYGGAFKVTRGLSTQFPENVFSTPIAEGALVGFCNGYALAGGRAVAEIMFGDFVTLAVDQIVNQAAKAYFMYGNQVTVPVTVRLASGGYRGYGPTHSQSLERLFCGVSGLNVVALSRRHRPQSLLKAAVLNDPNPVVFVENKQLYSLRPVGAPPAGFQFQPSRPQAPGHYPSLGFSTVPPGKSADVTLVTYGGITDLVEAALEQLVLEEELDFDYFVLSQLSPLYVGEIAESVGRTGRIVTVEEGDLACGIGSEVVARVSELLHGQPMKSARVAKLDLPIPSSRRQEADVLPSTARIVAAVLDLI